MSSYFFNTFKSDLKYIAESSLSDWDNTFNFKEKNNLGMNALHLIASIKSVKQKSEKIEYLISKNVKRDLVDDCGFIPVDYLMKLINQNHMMKDWYYSDNEVKDEEKLTKDLERTINGITFRFQQAVIQGALSEEESQKEMKKEIMMVSKPLCDIYNIWDTCVDIIHMMPDDINITYGKSSIIIKDKIQNLIIDITKHVKFTEQLSLERDIEKKILSNVLAENIVTQEQSPSKRKSRI